MLFLTDLIGSTVALSDASGALTTRYDFSPYGETTQQTLSGSPSTNPLEYTGRENDGTGLYYYRARYYSPDLKRFTQEDPLGFVDGPNPYAYVGGSPLQLRDPMGLWAWGDPLPQWMVDGAAGWGDMVSFGITNQIRNLAGTNGAVNRCSGSYLAGEALGFANTIAVGWAQGSRAVVRRTSGWSNYSHSFLPKNVLKKMDGSFWKWLKRRGNRLNGDFVSPGLHTRMDRAAQFGLSQEHLLANPLFSPFRQLINRMPYVPGSVLYGGGSTIMSAFAGDSCDCQ